MTHINRMTGPQIRAKRAGNGTRQARRETAMPPNVLQALRENQRLLREIASCYRMPRRTSDGPAAWASAAPPTISCPTDVVALLGEEMSTLIQEQLRILLLDTKNHVLGCELVYQGTIHSISIRAAEVLRPAILVNAPAIIVVHNHPSGDPTPSDEDLLATGRLMAAGDTVDIQVLDHIILGSEGRYVSVQERGAMHSCTRSRAA